MKENLRLNQPHARRVGRSSVHIMRSRFRFKAYLPLLLALAALALLAGQGVYSPPAGAQTGKARLEQDIEQGFINHEEVQFDPRVGTQPVRESGRLALVAPPPDFEVLLR